MPILPRNNASPDFKATPAHEAIFKAISAGDNVLIDARAGSGKTSTLVEACRRLPKKTGSLYLAFNKSVQMELSRRLPKGVETKTLNALGHRCWASHVRRSNRFAVLDLAKNKTARLCSGILVGARAAELKPTLIKLVGLAKNYGIVPEGGPREGLMPDNEESWRFLIERFGLQTFALEGLEDPTERLIQAARQVLYLSMDEHLMIDFDDQLWLPFVYDVPSEKYRRVFVDEAQDLSPLQHDLVARVLDPLGSVAVVGDKHQAIYGFRGAVSGSIDALGQRFGCESYPLHVTYRCPKAVVKAANAFVPDLEPLPDAPDGVVDDRLHYFPGVASDLTMGEGGSVLVVCRTKAPIVRSAIRFFKDRRPFKILIPDLYASLVGLVGRLSSGTNASRAELLEGVKAWVAEEKAELEENPDDMRLDHVMDTYQVVTALLSECEDFKGFKSLVWQLRECGTQEGAVTLASIHKAKGLEADHVWLLEPHLIPHPRCTQDWEREQENNSAYVAITRSKRTLRKATTEKKRLAPR